MVVRCFDKNDKRARRNYVALVVQQRTARSNLPIDDSVVSLCSLAL